MLPSAFPDKELKHKVTPMYIITSHHITSHHITSHHITSHHITSHHITDGVIPIGAWFANAAKYAILREFSRDSVPRQLNGINVTKNAHVSDFYRNGVR